MPRSAGSGIRAARAPVQAVGRSAEVCVGLLFQLGWLAVHWIIALWRPETRASGSIGAVVPGASSTSVANDLKGRVRPASGVDIPRATAAVLIAARNEESVIEATLRSILDVYQREDVFIFCDACTDATAAIARRYLPAANVIEHSINVGKSHGLELMLARCIYPAGYTYVTFADADTTLDPQFLINTLKVLRKRDVACAVGQVRSRWYPTNVISVYRTYLYTVWQMIFKRLQSFMNAITIASGCSSTWKTRVLKELEFDHRMSTEDFSLTIQAHRKRLGKIKYVSSAVVWTQDPFSVVSFRRQLYRWNRAWWESVRHYRVGLRWFRFNKWGMPVGVSALDISTCLLTFDILRYGLAIILLPLFVLFPIELPLGFLSLNSRQAIISAILWQYGSIIILAIIVSIVLRRPRVALYSPLFIFIAYLEIFISFQSLISTARSQYRRVPRQDSASPSAWVSPERRKVV